MKTKVRIAAHEGTSRALRSLIAKVNESDIALAAHDVQVCAWLLEIAREIDSGQTRPQLAVIDGVRA